MNKGGVRLLLATSPFFQELSSSEREEIVPLFRLQNVRRGVFLFHEDSPADRLYFVTEGEIKILKISEGGQEVILHLAGPGDLIGGVAILGAQRYPATAQAQTDACIAILSGQTFWELMHMHPALSTGIVEMLLSRLQEAHETIRQMAFERVERRLARILLRLAEKSGQRIDEGVLMHIALTRQEWASMAGTTLESTSRIMSQWQKQGLIASRQKRILIRNLHGLVVIAEDLPRPATAPKSP